MITNTYSIWRFFLICFCFQSWFWLRSKSESEPIRTRIRIRKEPNPNPNRPEEQNPNPNPSESEKIVRILNTAYPARPRSVWFWFKFVRIRIQLRIRSWIRIWTLSRALYRVRSEEGLFSCYVGVYLVLYSDPGPDRTIRIRIKTVRIRIRTIRIRILSFLGFSVLALQVWVKCVLSQKFLLWRLFSLAGKYQVHMRLYIEA